MGGSLWLQAPSLKAMSRGSLLFVCFSILRLLKVKPEERLTIEGVLDHPWLNSTEALDNILPSAQLMMDKVFYHFHFFLNNVRTDVNV